MSKIKKLNDLLEKKGIELGKVYTDKDIPPFKVEEKLNEAKETPQVGDEVILVSSSYYSHEIIQITGSDVIVDNKKGRKAPAVILGKKNNKMGFYDPSFKIKINNLKKSGGSWVLKSGKRAIDGKDLEFAQMGRGKVFGYVNEAKLNETKFYAWIPGKSGKIVVNAKNLYDAKKQVVSKYKVPMTKWGLIALMSQKAYDDQQFRFEGKLKEGNPYGLTYKKGKTVKVKHKTSGKELIIIDKPSVRKEYEKIGYVAEGKLKEGKPKYIFNKNFGNEKAAQSHANKLGSAIVFKEKDGSWSVAKLAEGKLKEGIKRWKIYVKGQSKPFSVGADSSSKAKQLAHMMIKNSSIKIDKIVQEIVNEKHTVWRKTPHTGKIKKGMYVWFVDNRGTQRIKVKHIMKAKDGKDLYITNKGTFEEKDVAGY